MAKQRTCPDPKRTITPRVERAVQLYQRWSRAIRAKHTSKVLVVGRRLDSFLAIATLPEVRAYYFLIHEWRTKSSDCEATLL